MSAQLLQKQMIINKTKELGWKIRLKSMVMTLLTWGVWLGMAYLVYRYKGQIIEEPVIEIYYVDQIILIMIAIVLILMLGTLIWSLLSKRRK